jgi:hypothetical protein
MRKNIFLSVLCCLALASCVTTNPKSQRFSAINPTVEGDLTTFRIVQDQCSSVDYGDGRGESDCFNGNMRSQIQASKNFVPSTVMYDFKVKINTDLKYRGFNNFHPTARAVLKRPDLLDSALRVATWEGEYLHNYILNLKLDAIRGITFLQETCVKVEDLKNWNHIQLRVSWRGDATGSIHMKCNGIDVYNKENVISNANPECYVQNQCQTYRDGPPNPKTIIFNLGLSMQGYGYEWKKLGHPSPFVDLRSKEISLQLKDLQVLTN